MESEAVFRAMADKTRQRVLSVLSRQELSVSELVELLRQPQSTVSRHLKVLREAGLIVDRRDGPTVLYSVPAVTEQDETALGGRLLDWVKDQPLGPGLKQRLRDVVDRRVQNSDGFFGRIGHRWDTLREASFGRSFQWEAFLSLLPSTWSVADIGTGTGYMLPTLARHFDRVFGVDPVESMLELARRRVETGSHENISLLRGDLGDIPLDDGSVDLALAVLVLHHVADPGCAMREIHRVLRPGGSCLIVEQREHGSQAFQDRMHDHRRGIEPDTLRRLLDEARFAVSSQRELLTVIRGDDAPGLHVAIGRK
ncbi:MAG: ArsR/SmtB family transcription factor [Planctomycetota bacterium]|jgi:ArsR family transcriptional regulator